jgi:tRNA-Thr(GGU) m(6)t(6)A37 methyltransferase TsaA
MTRESITHEPIGTIETPFESPEGIPIQPIGADATGTVQLHPEYADGLQDLDGFSHCILVYHLHESSGEWSNRVKPFLDDTKRGIFATRAPKRPNSIGMSMVEITSVSERSFRVEEIDVVDGTPLLDIKPFIPEFDVPETAESGWFDSVDKEKSRLHADDRFL